MKSGYLELVIIFLALFKPQIVTGIQQSYDSNSCIFIGCACGYNEIKCPSSNVDTPFMMFPKRSLYKLTSRNLSLDLSNNQIERMPDDRFAHLDFYKVNLSSNKIGKISLYTFRDIGDLKILDFSNNNLHDFSEMHFKYFANTLKTLILEKNFLNQIDKFHLSNALSNLKRLENLNLAQNALEHLPDLTRLKNLRILYFTSNKITKLVDMLSYNCLLPASIVELHFQNNHLTTLNKNSFSKLKNLKYLNLAFNQISEISEASFVHLTSLTELNLRNNYIKHIPSRIFYTLIRLDHLDLSSQKTRLKKIDDYAFDRESSKVAINMIDLSNNHIEEITNKAFCTTTEDFHANIAEIDLRENNLREVTACVMRQLQVGFHDGFRVLIKTSKSFNNLTNHHHLLKCDCELTYASKLVNIEGDCLDENNQVRASSVYECQEYMSSRRLFCPKQYDCSIQTSTVKKPVIVDTTTPVIEYTPESSTNLFGYEPLDYIDLNTNNSQIYDDEISNSSNVTVIECLPTASTVSLINYPISFLLFSPMILNIFILDLI